MTPTLPLPATPISATIPTPAAPEPGFSPDWFIPEALTPAGFQAESAAAQADAAPPTERPTLPPLTLELSADAQPRRVTPGEVLTYTISAIHTGHEPLRDITIADVLPAGVVFVPQSATNFDYTAREQALTWRLAELQPGAVVTGTFQVRVQGLRIGEAITNTLTATSATADGTARGGVVVDIVPPLAKASTTDVTATAGGWLRSADGRVEVQVPPGAVKGRQQLTHIAGTAGAQIKMPDALQYAFTLNATDEAGAAVARSQAPLKLVYPLSAAELKGYAATPLTFYAWDAAALAWQPLPTQVDYIHRTLTATTATYTTFGIAAAAASGTNYEFDPGSRIKGARPQLYSGSISYAYDFELPPGRGGLTPALGLNYSSSRHQRETGHFNFAGHGWDILGENYAGKANPVNPATSLFTAVLNGTTYTLNTGPWAVKENPFVQTWAYTTPTTIKPYYELWLRTSDGVKYTFRGYANVSSAAPVAANQPPMIYRWQDDTCNPAAGGGWPDLVRLPLTEVLDPNGNQIVYNWEATASNTPGRHGNDDIHPDDHNCNYVRTVRLTEIVYNFVNNTPQVRVQLRYDNGQATDTLRWDRPQYFPVNNMSLYAIYKLMGVDVKVLDDGGVLRTVRQYNLAYHDQCAGGCGDKASTLLLPSQIQESSPGSTPLVTAFDYDANKLITTQCDFGYLTTVTGPYGGQITFTAAKQAVNCTTPRPPVVLTHKVKDLVTGQEATWQYATTGWNQDAYGYSQVNVRAPALADGMRRLEQHYFLQMTTLGSDSIDHLAGREYQTITCLPQTANPNLCAIELQKTVTTWQHSSDNLPLDPNYPNIPVKYRPRFVYADSTETWVEGQRLLRTESYYQTWRQGSSGKQYGNLTERQEKTATSTGWAALPERTRYFWYYPTTVYWIFNKLATTHLYKSCYSCTGASLKGASKYYYDGATSETTPPTLGRLTKQVDGLWDAETTTQYTYWSNGNLRQVIDVQGRATETFYDSRFQAYPVCVKNAKSQTARQRYYGVPGSTDVGCTTTAGDPAWSGTAMPPVAGRFFGLLQDATDANNVVAASYRWDSQGRIDKVIRPGDDATNPTLRFSYTAYAGANQPFRIKQEARDNLSGGTATYLETRTFYDGLGQVIQTQAEGASATQSSIASTQYNADGQVVTQNLPYAGGALGNFVTPDWTKPTTLTTYDALGRPKVVTAPDNTTTRMYYRFQSGDTYPLTAVIDANNRQTITASDAWSRLMASKQYSGAYTGVPGWGDTTYATSSYAYDVDDSLVDTWGADNANIHITYDSLGRKTQMVDPDMSTWTYGYDSLGNLTRQTDARGQTICFYYDELNRQTGKHYRSDTNCPTTTPTLNVSYFYDAYDGVSQFGKGRRTEMQDASGLTRWQYDVRGRVTLERKSFNGIGFVETSWTYDAADRVQSSTYPGGEVVTTSYTSQGLPNALTNQLGSTSGAYVLSTTYDEAGRPDIRSLNNGLQTDYNYHAWTTANGLGRLWQIKTTVGAAGAVRQDLRYGYDAVGNVTAEVDALNVTGGTPGFQRQCFLYDALNRLLRAWTTANYCDFTVPNPDTQGAQPYDESYTYQPNGNLATKGATGVPASYSYGQQATSCPEGQLAAKPHAVVAVGADDYCYDQNGNMRRREIWGQTETLSYDAENHHTALSSSPSGAQYAFTYDGAGARATATTGTGESATVTAYAGPLLELDRLYGENFDDGLAQGWTAASGTWAVTNGVYRQSATTSNTNAYRAQTQGQGTYIFRWIATFTSGTNAGFYLFASASTGTERGNSYRIWQDATSVKIYENASNVATQRASFPAANAAGQTNIYQVTYDTRTGQIAVWRAGGYLGSWTDTTPLTSGSYISLRTDVANVSFDGLIVLSVVKYYYSGGQRIALRRDGTVSYLLTDQLGSTRVTTSDTGVQTAEMKYYPFGWTRYNSGGQKTTYRFTGQRFGPGGGGLYDYGARWYDSTIGRFIQADSIVPNPGNPQSLNRYAYVLNNPLRFVDPTGHCATNENDVCDPVETRREHTRIRVRRSPHYAKARLALANMIYGEQGGETESFQVVAGYVAWNRAGHRLENVVSVVAAPNQFQGYQGPHIPIPEPTGRARRAWDDIYNEIVPDVLTGESSDLTGGAIFFANIDAEQEGTYADTLARLVQDRFPSESLSRYQALVRAGYGFMLPGPQSATGHSLVYNRLASVALQNYQVASPQSPLNVSPGTESPRGSGRHGEAQP